MKRIVTSLLPLLLLCGLAHTASAQPYGDARSALSSFPEAQAVLYVNAGRLINVAMPRVMPQAQYKQMIADAQKVGFDPRGLEYAAVGVRFIEGAPAASLPEFVGVVRGSFNADSLLTLARIGLGGEGSKFREEPYEGRTLIVFDTAKVAGSGGGADGAAQSAPPYAEVAVASLDPNTLVFGVPSYVKAAVDSAGGRGRLKPATLELAARDPDALWSLTADLPPDLPSYLSKAGMPANEEVSRVLGWLRSFTFSAGIDDVNFTTRASVLTDSAEHASALDGIVQLGLTAATAAARAEVAKKKAGRDAAQLKTALDTLEGLRHSVEGSTVQVAAAIPVSTVADLVQKEMAKGQSVKPRPRARRPAPRRRAGRR